MITYLFLVEIFKLFCLFSMVFMIANSADVWKIQALKCFKITVMGAIILIWKSCDPFQKIAIRRSISVCEAQFWCILINIQSDIS